MVKHHGLRHILHFALNRELSELYIALGIKNLAISMIAIFVPIYLFKELGFALNEVFYFFIVFSVAFAIFTVLGAKIATKIGFKHSILLSMPFMIIYYILLHYLSEFRIPVEIVASAAGIANGLFWIAFHTDFAKFSKRKNRAEEIGLHYFLASIAFLLGPIIGGLILTYLSFTVLFVIVSILLFASTIPLFFSADIHEPSPFSLKFIFSRKHLKDALVYSAMGIEMMANGVLWPLFIFIIMNSYIKLGIVSTIAVAFTGVFAVYVGRFADVHGNRKVLRVGAIGDIVFWFIRGFVNTVKGVFGVTTAAAFFSLGLLSLDAEAYNRANRAGRKRVEYLVMREIFICFGRILILGVMMFLFSLIGEKSFVGGFVLTGLAELLYLLF